MKLAETTPKIPNYLRRAWPPPPEIKELFQCPLCGGELVPIMPSWTRGYTSHSFVCASSLHGELKPSCRLRYALINSTAWRVNWPKQIRMDLVVFIYRLLREYGDALPLE